NRRLAGRTAGPASLWHAGHAATHVADAVWRRPHVSPPKIPGSADGQDGVLAGRSAAVAGPKAAESGPDLVGLGASGAVQQLPGSGAQPGGPVRPPGGQPRDRKSTRL